MLFTLYVDVLLARLKLSHLGCHIGNVFFGAVCYADDIALVAPTITSLKLMLNICDDFGKEYDVIFNADKNQLLHYGISQKDEKLGYINHNNVKIPVSESAIHLGHCLGTSNRDVAINKGINVFVSTLNGVINLFRNAHVHVKYKLFKTFCMPLYGCVLWDYSTLAMNKFFTQWRKGIRTLLNLPVRTHSRYIPLIIEDLPVEYQLYKRFLKFVHNLIKSENKCISLCARLMFNGSSSAASNNVNLICDKLKCSKYDIETIPNPCYKKLSAIVRDLYNENDLQQCGNIKDILTIRDKNNTRLSYSEIDTLLNFFCTD